MWLFIYMPGKNSFKDLNLFYKLVIEIYGANLISNLYIK